MHYVIFIWLITPLIIPLALLAIGIVNLYKKVKFTEIIIKLAAAFLLYFLATFVILAFGFSHFFSLLNHSAHVNAGEPFTTQHIINASLVIFGYACFGLFLCRFVKRDLTNSLRLITGNSEKLQSIFEAK